MPGGQEEPGKCNFCQGNGHIARYCPKMECRECRGKGHQERDCPVLKRQGAAKSAGKGGLATGGGPSSWYAGSAAAGGAPAVNTKRATESRAVEEAAPVARSLSADSAETAPGRLECKGMTLAGYAPEARPTFLGPERPEDPASSGAQRTPAETEVHDLGKSRGSDREERAAKGTKRTEWGPTFDLRRDHARWRDAGSPSLQDWMGGRWKADVELVYATVTDGAVWTAKDLVTALNKAGAERHVAVLMDANLDKVLEYVERDPRLQHVQVKHVLHAPQADGGEGEVGYVVVGDTPELARQKVLQYLDGGGAEEAAPANGGEDGGGAEEAPPANGEEDGGGTGEAPPASGGDDGDFGADWGRAPRSPITPKTVTATSEAPSEDEGERGEEDHAGLDATEAVGHQSEEPAVEEGRPAESTETVPARMAQGQNLCLKVSGVR